MFGISTYFSRGSVIPSSWLNDVNQITYGIGGDYGTEFVGFDGGTLTEYYRSKSNRVVDSMAALRTLDKTRFTRAFATGYYAAGDGGGGPYYYDASDTTSADNGGTIIVASDGGRWKLIHGGTVSVKQFGALAIANTASVQNLVFTPGAYSISANITFNGRVRIENGAVLTAATGVTVTFNGGLEAGRHQIFAGTGTFVGNHKTTAALPEWWGAVAGDSGTDSAPAITKAIAFGAAQGCVDLSASSNANPYYTATPITATRNNVWLRSVGNNAQIVTTTAAASTANVFTAGDGVTLYSGFTLENVTFAAQNAASSSRRAVVFNYCSVVKLKNVIIYGTQVTRAWYDALWLNSCVQVDIDRTCEISGATQAGIRLSGASGKKTIDVQCNARIQFNGSGYAIGPYCEGIFDRGSIIFSTDGYCVSINGSASDSATVIKFFGTDFDTCTGAVYADYATNLMFADCWASGISASAGSVVVLKSTVTRATFDGGRYFGNSGKKMFELDADNVGVKNIEGSTCTEFVYASAAVSRLQVQNNMFDGITTYAVNKLAGPDKVMITGNDFSGATISTGGTNLVVANNV